MLQPLKMQGEARNCEKRCFGALHAQLCELCVQDQLENLTNCPLLIATHSDFYALTLKNARGSQKSQKQAFWRASRAIARAARAIPQNGQSQYRGLGPIHLHSNFHWPSPIFRDTSSSDRFRAEVTPPCSSLSEPVSKREPPRFARRLIKKNISKLFKNIPWQYNITKFKNIPLPGPCHEFFHNQDASY